MYGLEFSIIQLRFLLHFEESQGLWLNGCHRDQVENGSRCWICKGSDRASEQKNSQNILSTKEAHFNSSDSPQDKFYCVLVMMNNHDNFTKNTSKSRPFINFECLCTFYTHKPSPCTVRDPMPLGLL